MIVRDNARTIVPCLESARPWVDEIIAVDTGSVDDTPTICRRLGAKVYSFPWIDDFSAARNESLQHATGQWIFWMDSDDTLPPDCGRMLRELVGGEHAANILGYVMQVHCPGPEGIESGDMTVVDHVKLFRNLPALRFEGRIHEQIIPAIRRLRGDVAWTSIYVVHSGSEHTTASKQRKYERDLRILELDLAERPDHPFVLFNLGMTYHDMESHEEAVAWLRQALAASRPEESHVRKIYALLVASLTQLARWGEAELACATGLRHFPRDPELRFRQGLLAQSQHRFREAITAYRAALRGGEERHFSSMDPGIRGHKARHNLALAYEESGRPDLAELQWRLVLQQDPRFRPAWRGLRGALLAERRETAAGCLIEQMLHHPATRADGLVARAQAAEVQGNLEQARADLQSAIEIRPADDAVWDAWCRFLFDHGTLAEAAAALGQQLEISPNQGAAWHNLGVVQFRQGALAQAEQSLARSLELRPDSRATRTTLEAVRQAISPRSSTAEEQVQLHPRTAPDFGLAPCHSRREFDPQEGRYFCAHPRVGTRQGLVSPEFCRTCTLWQQPPPPQFRPRPAPLPASRRTLPCQHLGEPTGLRRCPTCRGEVQIKVFACRHPAHQETTYEECQRCGDYVPGPAALQRPPTADVGGPEPER